MVEMANNQCELYEAGVKLELSWSRAGVMFG